MKEEDTDWMIYHLIVREPATTVEDLVVSSGIDPGMVDASLERLERYFLIKRDGGKLRALNIGESLIRCQVKYSDDLPYTIENGVIKERKK
ncbi:MAG TPA: MarR family transcriptional regulator [Methanoregula sp.]|nr:MarR family transcriptional regulator [Methanoregula sp.]